MSQTATQARIVNTTDHGKLDIKALVLLAVLPAAMLPVIIATGVFNAVLVGALYIPVKKALKVTN